MSNGQTGTRLATTWVYDPPATSWTTLAGMPSGRTYSGFGMINGHLYVAGGEDGGTYRSLLDYDVVNNTWTSRAPLPAGAWLPGSAVVGGKLWFFGGIDTDGLATDATWIYNAAGDSWGPGP